MKKYKETFETWNKVACLYEEKFSHLKLYNKTYDFFCEEIPQQNAKILDIGCGPGNISKYIFSKRPNFQILGIDVAPNMIELAIKNNPKSKFEVLDCRKINSIKEKFNGLICGFVLPYLSATDLEKFVLDCNNLMETNGLLYLSFVEGNPEKSGYKISSTGDRVFLYFLNLDDLKKILKYNRFTRVKIFKLKFSKSKTEPENHIIIIARKN